jgi:hypothetical protein
VPGALRLALSIIRLALDGASLDVLDPIRHRFDRA